MAETVNQIYKKYNKSELSQEVFKLRSKLKAKAGVDPNIAEAEERQGEEALTRATALSPEEMAANMTQLGVRLNNTLQQVTSQIIQGRNTLKDLDKACEVKQSALEELYGRDVVLQSTGALLADYDNKKKELAQAEEEANAESLRAQQERERRAIEWDQNFAKQTQQKRDEFNYEFNKMVRDTKDQLQAQLKAEQLKAEDENRAREKAWQEREEAITKTEMAVAEREAKAEQLEGELKTKYERDKAVAISAVNKDWEHKFQLKSQEASTAQQIAAAELASRAKQITDLEAEIQNLRTQLSESKREVADIANKALEASSGRMALDYAMQTSTGGADGKTRRSS